MARIFLVRWNNGEIWVDLELSRSVHFMLFLVTRCHSGTFSAQCKKFYLVAFFQLPYWRSDKDLASGISIEAPEKKATG